MKITKVKNFLLDLFFPKFCLGCQKEGGYLCQDCQATLDISGFHQGFQKENLSDLYFPLEYKIPLIKKIIQYFKYQPFVRELSQNLSSLNVSAPLEKGWIIVPVNALLEKHFLHFWATLINQFLVTVVCSCCHTDGVFGGVLLSP